MSLRIFISKKHTEAKLLADYCSKKSFILKAQSFLEFSLCKATINKPYSIIFFSSPRSVDYFLAQFEIHPTINIACAGQKTAQYLKEKGYYVNFTGEGSDMNSVAKSFLNYCGKQHVLFPISDRSLKTISRQLPFHQKEEIIVYRTSIRKIDIERCNIYFFTSPSNLDGFLSYNILPKNAKIFSWGSSTSLALNKLNIEHITLNKPSIEEVINVLNSIKL